ncbi:MAG: glycoside hydrolase family 127 protein [Treponema sp.]|jgi:DUF1680 family protein|nr:glycoside hydrolase family 127 protein [Treponema sp.]
MRFSGILRSKVEISDRLLIEKRNANRRYMMSLDSNALLQSYRAEAVLDDPFTMHFLKSHGGWEAPTCQLRGHFPGHWLSAAAMHYASTGDMEIKAKADVIVAELARCQKANGGEWVASIPEKYLDRIACGQRPGARKPKTSSAATEHLYRPMPPSIRESTTRMRKAQVLPWPSFLLPRWTARLTVFR